MKKFDNFRFEGLEPREFSNNYLTLKRVSQDENKIVVNIAESHLLRTKYGYALILDNTHVVFIKDWQVNNGYYGFEVILDRNFWNVEEWGGFSEEFSECAENYDFNTWVQTAKEQSAVDEEGRQINPVKWRRKNLD